MSHRLQVQEFLFSIYQKTPSVFRKTKLLPEGFLVCRTIHNPIILVKRKNGETRICVDYRAMNAKTIKDYFPLPRVEEHLETLRGCKYFTTLHMVSGYHQIKMAEDSIQKTALSHQTGSTNVYVCHLG